MGNENVQQLEVLKDMDKLDERIQLLNDLNFNLPIKNTSITYTVFKWTIVPIGIISSVWLIVSLIKADDYVHWAIISATLLLLAAITFVFSYYVIEEENSKEQHVLDTNLALCKEREMSVISLHKSLAGKVLDSITFDNKKDGGAEKEKKDESDNTKLKEQYEHEERMAIINALGNNCSKESISEIQEGIKDIQKILKDIHN